MPLLIFLIFLFLTYFAIMVRLILFYKIIIFFLNWLMYCISYIKYNLLKLFDFVYEHHFVVNDYLFMFYNELCAQLQVECFELSFVDLSSLIFSVFENILSFIVFFLYDIWLVASAPFKAWVLMSLNSIVQDHSDCDNLYDFIEPFSIAVDRIINFYWEVLILAYTHIKNLVNDCYIFTKEIIYISTCIFQFTFYCHFLALKRFIILIIGLLRPILSYFFIYTIICDTIFIYGFFFIEIPYIIHDVIFWNIVNLFYSILDCWICFAIYSCNFIKILIFNFLDFFFYRNAYFKIYNL